MKHLQQQHPQATIEIDLNGKMHLLSGECLEFHVTSDVWGGAFEFGQFPKGVTVTMRFAQLEDVAEW